jgi:hypothetical protein
MSAHMDERITSLGTSDKLFTASLATANSMGPHVPRTSVRDGGLIIDHTSHTLPPHTNSLPVHDKYFTSVCHIHYSPHTNILPVHVTNILPVHVTTCILPMHDTNILPPYDTHTLPPYVTQTIPLHTNILPVHATNI